MKEKEIDKKLDKMDLTLRQKGFIKDYLETKNGTEAAMRNYNIGGKHGTEKERRVAGAIAGENLAKPKIIKAIQTIAERIDDDKLFRVLDEGLEAGKSVYKKDSDTGEFEEVGFEADYSTRHKYLDTAFKIKGTYAPEKKSIEIDEEIKEAITTRVKDILDDK